MAARHCIVRDSSLPAGLLSARRWRTVGTYLTAADVGNALMPAETPVTTTASVPARASAVHFFLDPAASRAKMMDPTTTPKTRPITVLLFCANTRASEFTPATAR